MKNEVEITKQGNDLESFCEHHGFVFHSHGHGKWAAFPFYTFSKKGNDGKTLFSIEYTPFSGEVKIDSGVGEFRGRPKTADVLLSLLSAMQIDPNSVADMEQSHNTAVEKMKRKFELANRIATKIKMMYGFRDDKCLEMATEGEWWHTTNHLSQMSNRNIDIFAQQVIEDIESGKMI